MKKTFLSLILMFTFAGYAFYTRATGTPVPVTLTSEPNTPKAPLPSSPTDTYVPTEDIPIAPVSKPKAVKVIKKPTPRPTPTPVPPPPVVNTGQYRNGSYVGAVVDAYYGNVQVKVTISGGKITDVQFLDYPQDRSTSVRINTRAMPTLISEAITAQNANVDGVSGASATSAAYQESLAGALAQAKN